MKITREELALRKSWSLDIKLEYFCKRVSEFIIFTKGQCYMSWSGGADSQVGCDIIDKIYNGTFKHLTPQWERVIRYPKPPRVFSNTGNEYPEVVIQARNFEHTQIKPKMGFTRVIKEIGVAVVSKDVAQKLKEIRNTNSDTLRQNRLFGDSKGNGKLPEKWRDLINAPFLISDECCKILKKDPFKIYERETGRKPIVFTTVEESTLRVTAYLRQGCNTFGEGKEKCRPYSIFKKEDTWEYANRFGIGFAAVYYDREELVEQLDGTKRIEYLPAKDRTGCAMCMFGIHLESPTNNRMQQMAISHPKYHDMIINKCGLGTVLSWMKIPYYPVKTCSK